MFGKVLIVDDDDVLLGLMKATLEPVCAQVSCCTGGAEALQSVMAEIPDLILLDMVIPDLDGLKLTRAIRRDVGVLLPRIVMISGVDSVATRLAAYGAGVDDFICKPVNARELTARVSAHLNTVAAIRSVASDVVDDAGSAKNDRYAIDRRFAELGFRCAGLLHDARGALATLQASVDIMRLSGSNSPELERVRRAVDRMRGVMTAPLAYINGDAAAMAEVPISLRDVVRAELEVLTDHIRSQQVHVELDIDHDFSVRGSAVQLGRAVGNLLRNSVDAMRLSERRELTLRAEFARGDQAVALTIEDTGRGLPPAKLARLFEVGKRQDLEDEAALNSGCGLGLAVVKAIIDEFHGEISVESQVGRGTKFTLILPLPYAELPVVKVA